MGYRVLGLTGSWGRVLGLGLVLGVGAVLVSCVMNPATGKEEFVPFMPSKDQQVQLGLQAAPQFVQQGGGQMTNPTIVAYVSAIGHKVSSVVPPAEAQGYQFTYTPLNDTAVNAFALPGGPIFITKGILYKMTNEAELAFVLGHETGHVVAQHVGRQMSKQTEVNVLLQGADAAAGGKDGGMTAQLAQQLGQFASQMYLLKYSREDESQADHLGLVYTVAAGYNPQASIQVMQVLDSLGSSGNEWMQTHPAPKNRIALLQGQIQGSFPTASNDPKYQLMPGPYQQNVLGQK